MVAIRYSCPIRLVLTNILLLKEIRLLGTDGQRVMARSTRLVMLIKNIYTLYY